MLKSVFAALAIFGTAAMSASPAAATGPGRAKPQIKITAFHAQTGGAHPTESQLTVVAHDPDGVIWEVLVEWGDGTASFATTACVQGHKPGVVATLIIPHTYAARGHYTIYTEASSLQQCPFDGPSGVEQHSRGKSRTVVINRV